MVNSVCKSQKKPVQVLNNQCKHFKNIPKNKVKHSVAVIQYIFSYQSGLCLVLSESFQLTRTLDALAGGMVIFFSLHQCEEDGGKKKSRNLLNNDQNIQAGRIENIIVPGSTIGH